MSDSTR